MATLAEMLVAQTGEATNPNAKPLADSFKIGADIALEQEKLSQNKTALAQKQQDAKAKGREQFTEYLFKAQGIKDPMARKNYLKSAPRVRDMWQVSPDEFSDEAINSLSASDEDSGRAYTLAMDVQNPHSPLFGRPDLALSIYNDTTKRIDVISTPPELRAGGEDFGIADAHKNYLTFKAQELQRQQQGDQYKETRDFQKQKEFADNKQKLEGILRPAGLLDAETDLNTLDKGIKGGINGYQAGSGEIAGISGTDGKLPSSELRGQAAQNRQALQRLVNIKLKQMSGSAVMDQELARNLDALGVSVRYLDGNWVSNIVTGLKKPTTGEKVIQGLQYLERSTRNQLEGLKKTYGPDVYNEVTAASNTTPLSGAKPPTAAVPAPATAPTQTTDSPTITFRGKKVTVDWAKQFLIKNQDYAGKKALEQLIKAAGSK